MDSIDEAILFFFLSTRFEGLQSPESEFFRIRLIVGTLEGEFSKPVSFLNDQGEPDFAKRYVEFKRRLEEIISAIVSSHGKFDAAPQLQILESLDLPPNASDPISLARAIQDLLFKRRGSQREELKKKILSDPGERGLAFSVPQQLDVQRPNSDISQRMISTLLSDPHRFAVDPGIGTVSFEELKKLYERDTGV